MDRAAEYRAIGDDTIILNVLKRTCEDDLLTGRDLDDIVADDEAEDGRGVSLIHFINEKRFAFFFCSRIYSGK